MVVDDALLSGAHRAIERWGYRHATLESIAA
jgi:tRNA G37 N-methylase TrmD